MGNVETRNGTPKEQRGFRKLLVWHRAYALALEAYKATANFPKTEAYGLASQMQRAAVSVPANIAEGYGRQHTRDYLRFLTTARGSLSELETYILLTRDLGYLNASGFDSLDQLRMETARLLNGLIKSLEDTAAN